MVVGHGHLAAADHLPDERPYVLEEVLGVLVTEEERNLNAKALQLECLEARALELQNMD